VESPVNRRAATCSWIPKPPGADLQAMVDEGAAPLRGHERAARRFYLGSPGFKREEENTTRPSGRKNSSRRRGWTARPTGKTARSQHGPGFVAAVCIRDYWDEMSPDQRDWCVDVVCSEVLRHAGQSDHVEAHAAQLHGGRPRAAFVLALLLGKALPAARVTVLSQLIPRKVFVERSWRLNEDRWAVLRLLREE
jgi:hypothetical protein